MAKDWWLQTHVQGFAGFRIFKKLQLLKVRIKDCKREAIRNIDWAIVGQGGGVEIGRKRKGLYCVTKRNQDK